jgi:thiamine biosynthesis protein ThiI
VAHFTEAQQRLREAGPAELAVVLYRRMMIRVADLLCDRTRSAAIVTGENLGQVASQTLVNMANIENAARHIVLRPLLTYDKMETTALARKIGTYDTSALPYEDCCSLFIPAHPATAAKLADVEAAEQKLDVAALAAELAAGCERVVV